MRKFDMLFPGAMAAFARDVRNDTSSVKLFWIGWHRGGMAAKALHGGIPIQHPAIGVQAWFVYIILKAVMSWRQTECLRIIKKCPTVFDS